VAGGMAPVSSSMEVLPVATGAAFSSLALSLSPLSVLLPPQALSSAATPSNKAGGKWRVARGGREDDGGVCFDLLVFIIIVPLSSSLLIPMYPHGNFLMVFGRHQ